MSTLINKNTNCHTCGNVNSMQDGAIVHMWCDIKDRDLTFTGSNTEACEEWCDS